MTIWAGWFCFAVLAATTALHVYWGLGGLWPASSEPELVRMVVGLETDRMPARGATLAVAALIFASGTFGLMRGVLGWDSLVFVRLPLAIVAAVFLLRGAATYVPGLQPFAAEPFARLNALYFSPLILLLGVCFAYLTLAPRQ